MVPASQPSPALSPIEILLVEDSEGDIVLTEEALRDAKVLNRLSVARDGEEAMERVRREEPYADHARPDLILLDLNLPRKDGREVLRELKQDDDLKRIPVVVLTTSAAERDVLAAYDQHVNAYSRSRWTSTSSWRSSGRSRTSG